MGNFEPKNETVLVCGLSLGVGKVEGRAKGVPRGIVVFSVQKTSLEPLTTGTQIPKHMASLSVSFSVCAPRVARQQRAQRPSLRCSSAAQAATAKDDNSFKVTAPKISESEGASQVLYTLLMLMLMVFNIKIRAPNHTFPFIVFQRKLENLFFVLDLFCSCRLRDSGFQEAKVRPPR